MKAHHGFSGSPSASRPAVRKTDKSALVEPGFVVAMAGLKRDLTGGGWVPSLLDLSRWYKGLAGHSSVELGAHTHGVVRSSFLERGRRCEQHPYHVIFITVIIIHTQKKETVQPCFL